MRTPFAMGENLTETGMVSPAAKALCGIVKAYMTLPGHVFSISRVCVYSAASGANVLDILMAFRAFQSVDSPGRMAVALHLYSMTQLPEYVLSVAGNDPGTCKEKGKTCLPDCKVWACW